MVHIEKDYNNPPSGLMDNKWNSLKSNVLIEKNNHKAKKECYRDTTLKVLSKLYFNKCACCERSRGEELQVDHYRPRKARDNKTDSEYNHNGYYWLTYEWNNLIPLCSSCNNGKSNFFPLKNGNTNRISNHTNALAYNIVELQNYEEPLFINPELDKKPQRHFLYLPNGKVKGRTPEGITMVEFYKLNSRTKVRDRKKVIGNYIHDIGKSIGRFYKSNDANKKQMFEGSLEAVFSNIIEKMKKKHELSLLHFFINQYFDEFIVSNFPLEWKTQIINSFIEFKKQKKI